MRELQRVLDADPKQAWARATQKLLRSAIHLHNRFDNESEQAPRTSVVHRKVTNGFRSEWGAKTYAAIQTIIAIAQQKGQQVFETIVRLMGAPILHYFEASSP